MAETIETSEYTSGQQRAIAFQTEANAQTNSDRNDSMVSKLLTRDFGKLFATVAGKPKVIESTRSQHRHQRYKIRNRAKELLAS